MKLFVTSDIHGNRTHFLHQWGDELQMRDPEQIRKFCHTLAEIWETNCPDWRFGRLITNVIEGDPFYVEDEDMLQIFKAYFPLEE